MWVTVVAAGHAACPPAPPPAPQFHFFGEKESGGLFGFSYLSMQEEVSTLVFLNPLATCWFPDLPRYLSHREKGWAGSGLHLPKLLSSPPPGSGPRFGVETSQP